MNDKHPAISVFYAGLAAMRRITQQQCIEGAMNA